MEAKLYLSQTVAFHPIVRLLAISTDGKNVLPFARLVVYAFRRQDFARRCLVNIADDPVRGSAGVYSRIFSSTEQHQRQDRRAFGYYARRMQWFSCSEGIRFPRNGCCLVSSVFSPLIFLLFSDLFFQYEQGLIVVEFMGCEREDRSLGTTSSTWRLFMRINDSCKCLVRSRPPLWSWAHYGTACTIREYERPP